MEKEKILIIKTGNTEILYKEQYSKIVSLGDVIRTTPLLYLYKDCDVTWATDLKAFPLLEGNPYIHNLININDWAERRELQEHRFDKIINLEKTPGVCLFADEDLKAWQRFGFRFDPLTKKAKAHDKAAEALIISFDEGVKKDNKKSFQEFLFEMVGEKFNGEEYVLGYKPKTKEIYDIGFNTQVGNKWPSKAWPIEKWDELERKIGTEFSVSRQEKAGTKVLNDLYSYIDWINSCNLLITNDSLGIHIALALGKKVLCLFGPTSENELYLYNRGKILFSKNRPDCAPCFEPSCHKFQNSSCMDLITTQEVYQEVKNLLDKKNNVSLENTNTYNLKKDEKVMKRKVVLILSISSDIGKYLAKRYSEQGDLVIGTYRKTKDLEELKQIPNCYLFFCDVDNETSIVEFVKKFNELNLNWDVFISCVGTPFPLQPFFKSNFDEWNKSFHTNSIEQLRVLYYLYPLRKKDEISNAVFFTGGGSPNKVAINISAYHVARMMLTKMCEILDAENKDLNVFIIGPGWVKTKTHNLILEKIDKTDKKYEITKNFMEKSQGTNMEDIFKCINSLCEQGKEVVGGRNISVVHDDWKNKEHFSNILKDNPDIFKLRRVEDSSLMENIDK